MSDSDVREFFPKAERKGKYQNPDRSGAGDAAEAIATAVSAQRKRREFSEGKPLPTSTPEAR